MKIIEIKTKGSIPFPEEVVWQPGDDGKVAIVGDNGSGKTTLLDTIAMAFYGVTPNRRSESGREEGAIYGCFKEKSSYIEVKALVNGKEITVKRLIDPIAKTQKPYLYVNGVAVTEGKTKEFSEKFLEHTDLPADLFLSALYHSQKGKGHLVSLDQAGARELLGNLLGFHEYDTEFSIFDAKRKELEQEIASDEILAKNFREVIQEEKTTEESYRSKKESKDSIEKNISDNVLEVGRLQESLNTLKSGSSDLNTLLEKEKSFVREINSITEELSDISERRANNLKVINQAKEIRSAVETEKQLTENYVGIENQILELDKEYESQSEKIQKSNDSINKEIKTLDTEKSEKQKSLDILNDSISGLRSDLSTISNIILEAKKKSELLEQVPCNGVEVSGKKLDEACLLLADAISAKTTIPNLEAEVEMKEAFLQEKLTELDTIKKEIAKIDEKRLTISEGIKSLDTIKSIKDSIEKLKKSLNEITTEKNNLKPLTSMAPHLAVAEERIKEYDERIDQRTTKKEELEKQLKEVDVLISDEEEEADKIQKLETKISELETKKSEFSETRDGLISDISKLEAKLEEIDKAKARLATLGIEGKQNRLTRLRNLCEGLSPKGVRALKLDASGPEISATINDVLSECYGSRFQVSFKTTKETGKGTVKEDFSIAVYDEEIGEETFVDNKSGGQEAIIKEGISLGVAVYKIQKTGKAIETLIRDEADGGLTPENAFLYQKMLDKAMVLGGFKQVIFVSHKREVQGLADSVFLVANGKIEKIQQEVFSL
ncbi:AAA family ATPase [Leptospira meyeri]|uniref:AAA family ATPase n=1 Tax=Leptospira meyeri TaxID=29508 RepID=UPI0010830B2C|nr:SMC family ATPase [Leptospira meyeri]TGM22008.1 SMC family ATPase [Leptospira meyeri]